MACIVVVVPSSFSRDVFTKAPRLYGRTARASIVKELEINVLLVDARAVRPYKQASRFDSDRRKDRRKNAIWSFLRELDDGDN